MQKGRYVLTWSTRATRPVLLAAPPKTHSRVIRCAVPEDRGPKQGIGQGRLGEFPHFPLGDPQVCPSAETVCPAHVRTRANSSPEKRC